MPLVALKILVSGLAWRHLNRVNLTLDKYERVCLVGVEMAKANQL